MYIITVEGKENEGAYSVPDDDGEHILYLFEDEDDALRYAMMLEDGGYPEMTVVEVDEELMIKTCHIHGHEYAVITSNDIVIPPKEHDFI